MIKALLQEMRTLDGLVQGPHPPSHHDLVSVVLEAMKRLGNAHEAVLVETPPRDDDGWQFHRTMGPLGHLLLTRGRSSPPFSETTTEALELFSYYVAALVGTGEALRHAEVAQESKDRFMASLSHELRTPLNGILGFSQLLETSALVGDQITMVKNIDECGQRLLSTVDNILELAEYESEGFRLESDPFAPRAVLEAVSTKYASIAASKSLRWSLTILPGVPPVLRGDPVRLGQAWGHLLSNAVKFTLSGSIDVALAGYSRVAGRHELELTVDDTGVGLPQGAFARGILPFRQHDDALTRRFGGSGLGLSLCDRLVRAMEGSLDFEGRVGGGTRVRARVVLEETEDLR